MARVLVVEDSSVQALLEKRILENGGYQVEVTDSGENALECLQTDSFDLVVSDVIMPGMSGYELCQKIKSSDDIKAVPVVLITALNELKDLVEGLRVGADNFITKPFEPDELLDRVELVLHSGVAVTGQHCDPDTGTCFISQKFVMNLDRKKVLDFLVSTFDDFFRTRQRENEMRAKESRRRLMELEQKEQFLNKLTHDLSGPIDHMQQELKMLVSGCYGALTPQQIDVINRLRNDGSALDSTVDNLVGNYRAVTGTSTVFGR